MAGSIFVRPYRHGSAFFSFQLIAAVTLEGLPHTLTRHLPLIIIVQNDHHLVSQKIGAILKPIAVQWRKNIFYCITLKTG
ncbi:MAG: hypothetical protein EBT80_05630 [Chitinophagales bacterium]|nr:hypothetical protein [Chitinophagales bacterium]